MKNIFFLYIFFISVSIQAQTWSALGNCFNGYPETMIVYKNKLYMAAGGMQMACLNKQEMGITIFDGQYFDSLPGETNGIKDFCIYQDSLVAGGNFLYAGYDNFPSVNYTHELAYWDGYNWQNTGLWSIDGSIEAVAVYNGELYVGGGVSLPNINPNAYYNYVKWNGTQWDSVGGKFGPNWVRSMCADTINNKLYIGGGLAYAGTTPVWSVACWDGASLTSPGGFGITNGALAMSMFNNALYVGGTGFSDTILSEYD